MPGQSLDVQFLDIDLAGRLSSWEVASPGLRIMSEVTWPSMRLHYTLQRDGMTVASGDERLVNLDYLGAETEYMSSDPLRFDKALLDRWLDRRFAEGAAVARP